MVLLMLLLHGLAKLQDDLMHELILLYRLLVLSKRDRLSLISLLIEKKHVASVLLIIIVRIVVH